MKYSCPICQTELMECPGEDLHPGNPEFGVTLFCPNRDCPPQEVKGHGKNAARAYDIIMAKFTGARVELEQEPEQPS